MTGIAVLGSTGSIGCSTLEVLRWHPGRWQVTALAAGRNVERLAAQVVEFEPALVVTADGESADELRRRLESTNSATGNGAGVDILHGVAGLEEAARSAALVVNGLVGAMGLRPTLAAVERGARVALANKESMVVGGELVRSRAAACGAEILPVDSEHSALWQCMATGSDRDIRRLVLTASGGPLRKHPDWRRATPAEVLAHPVWDMGTRITTDSATMMNKGFEIIEARWLFDVGYDRIDVLVHPQAAFHALVEWRDGSVMAQAAVPDMRLPIQLALTWPQRIESPVKSLDLAALGKLEFEEPSIEQYPCLAIGREAGRAAGLAPTVLNAADEVAVELFHAGRIQLGELPDILRRVLDAHPGGAGDSLEAIEAADAWARDEARRVAVGV